MLTSWADVSVEAEPLPIVYFVLVKGDMKQ